MMENKKPDLSELNKLEEYLKTNGYSYRRRDEEPDERSALYPHNRHQIKVYNNDLNPLEIVWDVICHYGSYGYEEGLLEIMNGVEKIVDTPDGVKGHLTAQDVIDLLENKKYRTINSDCDLECENCEHHFTVSWCGKAIKNHDINKDYETGWMDGYSAKEEESPWILCEDDLPEMHDAGMLKKLGTQERSDKCLVTIECEGERVVDNDAELHDGEWYSSFIRFLKAGNKMFKVVAWMPMPDAYNY